MNVETGFIVGVSIIVGGSALMTGGLLWLKHRSVLHHESNLGRMIDTLALFKRFEAAGFTDEQARALVELVVEQTEDRKGKAQPHPFRAATVPCENSARTSCHF